MPADEQSTNVANALRRWLVPHIPPVESSSAEPEKLANDRLSASLAASVLGVLYKLHHVVAAQAAVGSRAGINALLYDRAQNRLVLVLASFGESVGTPTSEEIVRALNCIRMLSARQYEDVAAAFPGRITELRAALANLDLGWHLMIISSGKGMSAAASPEIASLTNEMNGQLTWQAVGLEFVTPWLVGDASPTPSSTGATGSGSIPNSTRTLSVCSSSGNETESGSIQRRKQHRTISASNHDVIIRQLNGGRFKPIEFALTNGHLVRVELPNGRWDGLLAVFSTENSDTGEFEHYWEFAGDRSVPPDSLPSVWRWLESLPKSRHVHDYGSVEEFVEELEENLYAFDQNSPLGIEELPDEETPPLDLDAFPIVRFQLLNGHDVEVVLSCHDEEGGEPCYVTLYTTEDTLPRAMKQLRDFALPPNFDETKLTQTWQWLRCFAVSRQLRELDSIAQFAPMFERVMNEGCTEAELAALEPVRPVRKVIRPGLGFDPNAALASTPETELPKCANDNTNFSATSQSQQQAGAAS